MEQGKATKVLKMREVISGSKKTGKEAHAIMDQQNKEMVIFNSAIKTVTLNYCLDVLKKNQPAYEVKQLIDLIETQHEVKIKDTNNDKDYE